MMKIIKYAVLAVAIVSIYLNFKSCHEIEVLENTMEYSRSEAKIYRDKLGRSVGEREILQTNLSALKISHSKELDQLEEDFNLRLKDLRGFGTITTKTSDSIRFNVIDSVQSIDTDWASYRLQINPLSLDFSYTIRDSISFAEYYDREWFLGPKKYYMKGISHNPNTEITGIERIEVTKSNRRFSVGLQAGYGITTHGLGLYTGIGFQFRLL